jgi:hypothetical protein
MTHSVHQGPRGGPLDPVSEIALPSPFGVFACFTPYLTIGLEGDRRPQTILCGL